MDTQQVSAPSRAPSAGVVHINIRLTDGYSIISNRLSQHRDMSLLAIGLGTHIQSLPAGRRIGVKALAAIFPESEARIAAALRELERHGFLRRIRERVQGGRVATRTESYNHPEAAARRAIPQLVRVPEPVQEQVPEPVPVSASEPVVVREPAPAPPAPAPAPAPAPRLVPSAAAPKPPPPPLPFPRRPSAPLFDEAARLLAGLQVSAPLFALSEVDVERLTPGVAAWLERGVRPDAVRVALTDDPPVPLRHPAKLLRHRLIALLPPPVPAAVPVVPLQNCDDCDRAFRSPVPGCCGECRDVRAYADDEPCLLGA
ncbi:hypothetical protein ASD97_21385 [Streptomyces sp. Root63]|uniref:hypothetical protein n=1 Tax=unclassified Streptomyces TaxID=2593676 RepID=UPI0006F2E26E|nr:MULTISPECIES: hypothetical protein [unclassified Streptomyces]KQX36461.1 hypothetical protein ASD29_04140 [Streptomyces sp. Root1295]KRA36730.1 hypothetical protein ASD97_21385 [Streptomyces sp. Root63]